MEKIKQFVITNKTKLLLALTILFMLGYCKNKSEVSSKTKSIELKEIQIDSLKSINDSLIKSTSHLNEIDGLKLESLEKQLTECKGLLDECNKNRTTINKTINVTK